MQSRRVVGFLLLLFIFSAIEVHAQTEKLPTGQVIERVSCKNNPEQTYALYLPSGFSEKRTWSLLAAFDPGARGKVPVERFREAAERYGYIVCGSNNSRNGPWPPTLEAANAMLNDVTTRFPIDEKRVYLTGFSGGARVATRIASLLTGRIAGVIGCGAGLGIGMEATKSLGFIYFGTVGNEDFNYPEMKQLDRALAEVGLTHRLERFEGSHSWAPIPVCSEAIEWMELQAIKVGLRGKDDALIDTWFKKASDQAKDDQQSGRVYDAYLRWSAIASDFAGLRDVGEASSAADALKESKIVKQAIKQDRDQENEQRRRTAELFNQRMRLRNPKTLAALNGSDAPAGPPPPGRGSPADSADDDKINRQIVISDLRGAISDLRKRANAKDAGADRTLARRILNEFMASVFEPAMLLIRAKQYDLAIDDLLIDAEVMPDNSSVLYDLACAYSLKGDKKRAIDSLNRAVQKGFSSSVELERNHDLDALRQEAGFQKIVELLKQKQPG